jgi:hypothetical protein
MSGGHAAIKGADADLGRHFPRDLEECVSWRSTGIPVSP